MSQVYGLIDNGSISLQVKLEGISENCDRVELKENLIDTMYEYKGLGLSASQCGILERVFVMYDNFLERKTIACFNPQVVISSPETIIMDEGCLTYPGLWLKVRRPKTVDVIFEDENGESQKRKYSGLEARVFQHEMDHMDGTDFTQKVSKLKLDMSKKRRDKALEKSEQYKMVRPPS